MNEQGCINVHIAVTLGTWTRLISSIGLHGTQIYIYTYKYICPSNCVRMSHFTCFHRKKKERNEQKGSDGRQKKWGRMEKDG